MKHVVARISAFTSGICTLAVVAILLPGCSFRNERGVPKPSAVVGPEASAHAVRKEALTVMNLLQWPLEGQAGIDRVSDALASLMVLKPLIASQFHADGPVRLADGHVVSFVFLRKLSGRIDVGLETKPCFPPELAQSITSAVKGGITQDMHGGDHGEMYTVERNGTLLRFTTTPMTYQCVTMIYIGKAKGPARTSGIPAAAGTQRL